MTDDLRARIADALRERMALVCRPGGELAAGELVDYIGATEHDLADAVLAVVQPPDEELTREEAIALSDDLGQQLYRAQDRVAFVREMLTGRTGTVNVAQVLAWLDHQHCPRVESEQQQIVRLTADLKENTGVLKALRRQRDQAEAAVERVRVIHHRVECSNVRCKVGGWCIGCDPDGAGGCSENPWPCPTMIAVSPDGEIPTLYSQWVLRRDHEAVKAERDRLAAELERRPLLTCGASHATGIGNPLGPCVLRYSHDGPVHKDAAGASWWLNTSFATGANTADNPGGKTP